MIRKVCKLAMVLFFCIPVLLTSDTAIFVDLGFSPDGKYFMYGQYWTDRNTSLSKAELNIVDVERNNFVSNGRRSFASEHRLVFNQNGSGALFHLIGESADIARRYNIDSSLQGNVLFLSMAAKPTSPPKTIEFKNFIYDIQYKASLFSQVEGSEGSIRSSFYIDLERTTSNGNIKLYHIGTPRLMRPRVTEYNFRKVITAPSNNAMIFIIEMFILNPDDKDFLGVRYMVEAVRLEKGE